MFCGHACIQKEHNQEKQFLAESDTRPGLWASIRCKTSGNNTRYFDKAIVFAGDKYIFKHVYNNVHPRKNTAMV